MSSLHWVVIICLAAGVVIAFVVFAIPGEDAKPKKIKKETREPPAPKDFSLAIERLEKHISSLKAELERAKSEERKILNDLEAERVRARKLEDKINQEKEWLAKEEEAAGKKSAEIHTLKENLGKAEKDFEKEYSMRIEGERQLKEIKQALEASDRERKELNIQYKKTLADAEYYRREFEGQKKIAEELTKKNEATDWIAKPEYDKLKQVLLEKEKELERVRRENSPKVQG